MAPNRRAAKKNAKKKKLASIGSQGRAMLAEGLLADDAMLAEKGLRMFDDLSKELKATRYLEFANYDERSWVHPSESTPLQELEVALSQAFLSMAHANYRNEFVNRPSFITKRKREVGIMAGKYRHDCLDEFDDPEGGEPPIDELKSSGGGAEAAAKEDDGDSVPDLINDSESDEDDDDDGEKDAESTSGDSVPDLIDDSDSDGSDSGSDFKPSPKASTAKPAFSGTPGAAVKKSEPAVYEGPAAGWNKGVDGMWKVEQWKMYSNELCKLSSSFLEYLRYCATVSLSWLKASVIQAAALNGSVNCLRSFLRYCDKTVREEFSYALCLACERGHVSTVELMLSHGFIDPSVRKDEAIVRACRGGSEKVLKLLLDDGRVDPSTQSNKPLETAIIKGHTALAEILICDKRVDGTACDDKAMDACIKHGNNRVAGYLVKNGGVKGTGRLIAQATIHSRSMIAALLKANMDPSLKTRATAATATPASSSGGSGVVRTTKLKAMRSACHDGKESVVKQMLHDNLIDPTDDKSYSMRASAANGHASTVALLLKDRRADPAAQDCYALKAACKAGHIEVVKLMLTDGRADPSVTENYAVRTAMKGKHFEVVICLLLDPRVECPDAKNWAIKSFFPPSKKTVGGANVKKTGTTAS